MEDLFTTTLSVNNENITYHVVFDQEKYIFQSLAASGSIPSFSFHLEHEEWQSLDNIGDDVKNQAIEALERYLLRQH